MPRQHSSLRRFRPARGVCCYVQRYYGVGGAKRDASGSRSRLDYSVVIVVSYLIELAVGNPGHSCWGGMPLSFHDVTISIALMDGMTRLIGNPLSFAGTGGDVKGAG